MRKKIVTDATEWGLEMQHKIKLLHIIWEEDRWRGALQRIADRFAPDWGRELRAVCASGAVNNAALPGGAATAAAKAAVNQKVPSAHNDAVPHAITDSNAREQVDLPSPPPPRSMGDCQFPHVPPPSSLPTPFPPPKQGYLRMTRGAYF